MIEISLDTTTAAASFLAAAVSLATESDQQAEFNMSISADALTTLRHIVGELNAITFVAAKINLCTLDFFNEITIPGVEWYKKIGRPSGARKANAIGVVVEGLISGINPASILQMHPVAKAATRRWNLEEGNT